MVRVSIFVWMNTGIVCWCTCIKMNDKHMCDSIIWFIKLLTDFDQCCRTCWELLLLVLCISWVCISMVYMIKIWQCEWARWYQMICWFRVSFPHCYRWHTETQSRQTIPFSKWSFRCTQPGIDSFSRHQAFDEPVGHHWFMSTPK